jgi:hypothetical protein
MEVLPGLIITTANPIDSYTLGTGSYYKKLTSAYGTGPYTWSIVSGALPPGLDLLPDTGELYSSSFAIKAAGVYNFAIQVTDGLGVSTYRPYTMEVLPGLIITTANPINSYTLGTGSYYKKLTSAYGTGPYTWSIVSGALPQGLTLINNTGELYVGSKGISTPGTYVFAVQVVDSLGKVTSRPFTLEVLPVLMVTTPSPLAGYTIGTGSYYKKITTSYGTGPYTWSVVSGAMPPGLTLISGTGELYAGSTAIKTPGSYTFTVQVIDGNSKVASKQFSINVMSLTPSISTPDILNSYTIGTGTYYKKLAVSNGTGPYTWAVTSGAMPSGLTLISGTGELYAGPTSLTTIGTYVFTVEVVDSLGEMGSKQFTLQIL